MKLPSWKRCLLGAALALSSQGASAAPLFIGPLPYLSRADSPFDLSAIGTGHFYFEDFEDGVLNVPVVITTDPAAPPTGPRGPSPVTDSVDGDDGSINGSGVSGWAYHVNPRITGDGEGQLVLVTFDVSSNGTMGIYPTHVGIVWTDGDGMVLFEAFDRFGALIGTIGPLPIGDRLATGATSEDRFFGVVFEGGVDAVRLGNTLGGIEVDHIQFGVYSAQVSEPTTLALFALALAGLLALRRRTA